MKAIALSGFALTLACMSPACMAPAVAADRSVTVTFRPGTSSAKLKGAIKGYDTATYTLGARRGQTLSVVFSPNGRSSCYFNVLKPDGEALFNGSINGHVFTGSLPSDGTYKVQAYLMRNDARRGTACNFGLKLEITG